MHLCWQTKAILEIASCFAEPRKMADQILTVRESICEEIIHDLGSILLENNEAIRYATTRLAEGKDAAEKSRKLTTSNSGASTPNRLNNYLKVSTLITGAALNLVREALEKSRDSLAQQRLEELVDRLHSDEKTLNPAQRHFAQYFGPRGLIEEVYYMGLIEGIVEKDGKKTNLMRMARSLLDLRCAQSIDGGTFATTLSLLFWACKIVCHIICLLVCVRAHVFACVYGSQVAIVR